VYCILLAYMGKTLPQQVIVTTLAGSGSELFADGLGTLASFKWAMGVAVNNTGFVYLTDIYTNRIRTISPVGLVTTKAGSWNYTCTDGFGKSASFNYPIGLAIDSTGYAYVADSGNLRIRMISPIGWVTTLAGSGVAKYADGMGTRASFTYPEGVAVDTMGYVYVIDIFSHRIRKISPSGLVSTLAGSGKDLYADGIGTFASFSFPYGIIVDSSGNIFIADTLSQRIRLISPTGFVTTFAGSGHKAYADGFGTFASFTSPFDMTMDSSGYLYVADTDNNRIRMISPTGCVTTVAGSGNSSYADGLGTRASFMHPNGVALNSLGDLFVADFRKMRKISLTGPPLKSSCVIPTRLPIITPSIAPSVNPSSAPTAAPSISPSGTRVPSTPPTTAPSAAPTVTHAPSTSPTVSPFVVVNNMTTVAA